MSNTSYTKAITVNFASYSATDSVLFSSDIPTRFYFRGLSVTLGQPSTDSVPIKSLVFQDGPGLGNQDGMLRVTGGDAVISSAQHSLMVPDDSYILIKNGLYFWSSVDSSADMPIAITVYYT